jgi:hypothetical protein
MYDHRQHQHDRGSNKAYNYNNSNNNNALSEALEQLSPFGLVERDERRGGLLDLTSLVRVLELNDDCFCSVEELLAQIYIILGTQLTLEQAEALHHALCLT